MFRTIFMWVLNIAGILGYSYGGYLLATTPLQDVIDNPMVVAVTFLIATGFLTVGTYLQSHTQKSLISST